MHETFGNDIAFIFTSNDPPEEDFFQGYFFCGNDYIYGNEGLSSFKEATGRSIRPGQDGCYVHMRRHSEALEFNTDFSGYKVIYYYHDGTTWAVSNSFAQIVDFLRQENWSIRPNYAHLGSICSTNSTNNQLFSFETLAQGVRVVPRATSLIVTSDKIHLLQLPGDGVSDYEEGLRWHLERWVSRFETLLSDERLQFSIDLTGGLDSRTNLALAIVAVRRLDGSGQLPRFTCAGSPEVSIDYQVALELSQHYGFELNAPNRVKRTPFTPQASFKTFRDLSLGVYHPLVIPAIVPSPFRIQAGGGGGEVHRDFYRPDDVNRFFENFGKRNTHVWLGIEASQDGRSAVGFRGGFDDQHPLRTHYREFRHRFHVGRAPRFSTSFTPLDSMSAETVQLAAGKAQVNDGQLNYDIISSLVPELLDAPFDSPTKAPNASIRSCLTSVEISADATPGKAWVGGEQLREPPAGSSSLAQRGRVTEQALLEAVDNPFVRSFFGEATIDESKRLAQKLAAAESIGNPVNGYPISAVLSAHLVAPFQ